MTFQAGQNATAAALNAASGVSVAGGLLRVTNSAFTSLTTELAWATTPALALAANTTYEVTAELYMLQSAGGTDIYIVRIRDTNVSGTIRQAIDAYPTWSGGDGPFPVVYKYTFTTTTAVSYTACATVQRFSGSETACAAVGSKLTVSAIGSSTVLTTA